MATLTDPDRESFKLSMLLYDTRYRSMTIQVIAMIGFVSIVFWLISNTVTNLNNLGKPVEFGFLFESSSYDINQRLVEYNSRDSHLRASFVGVLNTLVVAFLGCITATIIGVFVGVARLSKNWLVARIMTVYVEAFRNVPVLLWIVLAMAVLIEGLPAPKAFRGENATASLELFDSVALTNRGVYVPEPLFSNGIGDVALFGQSSLRFSVSLDLFLIIAVLIASFTVSAWIKRRANRIQDATGDRPTTWYLRLGVIILPIAFVLWVLGFHLGYPELKGFNFKGGTHLRNSLIALWLALSLYTAAFIAEIVRGGILAISRGQTEAAASLGLRPNRIMNLVVLPQALRVIIPPLISNYLNLTKNSSLAIAVGYMDVTGTLGGITLNQTGRELECILLLMLVYLTISLSISAVMNWYNNSVKLVER
ncbi:MAG: ABC transporter permease subunit [Rhodobacteraceae bacterium]|nr:ABC transporter permease subunit [Paracoccaceae bacterium]RZO41378.1 MAG: ABC transporter permease subunit [Paracoccaceae bacterium]